MRLSSKCNTIFTFPLRSFIRLGIFALFMGAYITKVSAQPIKTLTPNVIQHSKTLVLNKGWKTLNLTDHPDNQITATNSSITIESNNSVGFYYKKLLSAKSLKKSDWQLSWEWRLLETSPAVKTNVSEGDDRPIAIHLWLNDPKSAGWLKGSLAKVLSIPTPGYMLTYQWGGLEQQGDVFFNPHIENNRGVIKVLRNHDVIGEHWQHQSINIKSEFLSLLNVEASKKLYVVISADTEDSPGSALAEVRNIQLHQLSSD